MGLSIALPLSPQGYGKIGVGSHRFFAMSRVVDAVKGSSSTLLIGSARYFGWLFVTASMTLGGSLLLMLFKDWTIKSLFTSAMAWPALGMAMLFALPMVFVPLGKLYFYSAFTAASVYNLILLIS
jgi:hypothetical protein